MIPILFNTYDTKFTTNGLGRLSDCTRCIVTEERNGIYELEFDYPITGRFYRKMISEGGIVAVIHDDKHDIQPFDIYRYSAPIDGIVTFNAHHISYRLSNVIVKPFTASSTQLALNGLKTNAMNECPFTFWTDKTADASTFDLKRPDNIRALLGGQEGSILDVFGTGEYEFDNWTVRLYVNRGVDHGVTIRYGKNLSDIDRTFDKSGLFYAAVPFWSNGETYVNGGIVQSDQYSASYAPWTNENGIEMTDGRGNVIYFYRADFLTVSVLDFSSKFEEEPTVAQLEAAALEYLNNNTPWIPDDNIEVDFVALWQTSEYESVAALQRLSLCDKVSIYYPELGVTEASAEIVGVEYNVLLERYDKLTIGKPKTTLAELVTEPVAEIAARLSNVPSVSFMESSIDEATQKITGGLGGYVVMNPNADGQPQEILIMDTDDINTAVHVIRMNKNGIGFSNDGYAGPYTSAWTIDGKFNADFITAGTLNANVIRAGLLTDTQQSNYWNLETGEFRLAGTAKLGTGTQTVSGAISDAETNAESYALTAANNAESNAKNYASTAANNAESNAKNYADTASAAAVNAQTQQFIFNKLTNNGQTQGIYLSNGLLYINADYIQSGTISANLINGGTLSLGGSNNTRGLLKVYDRNGAQIGNWDAAGLYTDYIVAGDRNATYMSVSTYGFTINNAYGRINTTTATPSSGVTIPLLSFSSTASSSASASIGPGYLYVENGSGMSFIYMSANDEAVMMKSLQVTGTKNRVVQTDEYGERLLYCYETPSPLFGDVGEGVLDEDGLCYVFLDPVFAETITTTQYQVFVQKYGDGDAFVYERKPDHFIVKGTPGLCFGWELKAKQSDFDQYRLERPTKCVDKGIDYGNEGLNYYTELTEGRITA